MRKGNLLLLLLTMCFTSCEMLESHPYDAHITGERDINAKNCERIEEAMKGKKTFRFAMISDTQRWYDETEEVVKKINERGDIDLFFMAETNRTSVQQKNFSGCAIL